MPINGMKPVADDGKSYRFLRRFGESRRRKSD